MSPLGIWLGSIVIRLVASRPAWVLGPLSPEWLVIAAVAEQLVLSGTSETGTASAG